LHDQLSHLLPDGFLTATPWPWLVHSPRYLKAMSLRLTKLATSGIPRDRQAHEQIAPRWQQFKQRTLEHKKRGIHDAELPTYRWMVEELRVSLFAQELGASIPISPQRLDKQWGKVRI
jgi:ATP-dependent helicase HrpA